MYAKAFWLATGERAARTFCQALLGLLVADQTDLLTTDWIGALSAAGMATVLSVLTSVASSGVGGVGPSLANEVTSPPAPPVKDTP